MCRFNLNKINLWVFIFHLVFLSTLLPAAAEGLTRVQVKDQKGAGIPFATIRLESGGGVVTDENGEAEILLEQVAARVEVSAAGFEPLKVRIDSSRASVEILLKERISDLEEVVVTGNFEAQSARQSVYQVRSIDKAVIQKRAAGNMQEVLNTELGIRFSQDNALGASNLELNGLSGQNVKILIDGVPMVGRQGVSNEININQIDINQIERIEIVEGPMSVIYGADALAGVINIITKAGSGSLQQNQWTLSARLQEETVGTEYQPFFGRGNHLRSISGAGRFGSIGFNAGISSNSFGGWRGDFEGRQFDWLPREQFFANAGLNYTKGILTLDYHVDYMLEDIFSPGPESRLEWIDQNFITNRQMHRLNGALNLPGRFKLSWQGAYTHFTRDTEVTVTNVRTGERFLSQAPGAQARLLYNGLTWRMLGSWQVHDKLNIQPGIDINVEDGVGDRISENEGIGDYAAFLSAEWSPTPRIKIRPGIRSAYNTAFSPPPFIPSLNTKFILREGLDFRLAYAKGFRAPSIREMYFDFFDASHSIRGNPDLQAEISDAFNGSLQYQNYQFFGWKSTSNLSFFYNDVRNQIAFGVDPRDVRITTLFNVERFRTTGWLFTQSFSKGAVSGNVGYSRIGRFNRIGQGVEGLMLPSFVWANEVTANLMVQLPIWDLGLNVFYKYNGALPGFEQTVDSTAENPEFREILLEGFHWMDLTLTKPIGTHLMLTGGVRNMMDIGRINSTAQNGGAHGGGPERPMGYGRSYFLGITYQFNKK
ncbi:MAG: TonB-dependent receptor [Nitritalea sp.]